MYFQYFLSILNEFIGHPFPPEIYQDFICKDFPVPLAPVPTFFTQKVKKLTGTVTFQKSSKAGENSSPLRTEWKVFSTNMDI